MAGEFSHYVSDASINPADKALPASVGTVNQGSIDLNAVTPFLAPHELIITAPALGATPLPNGETMIYDVADSADNSSFTVILDNVITQTGAGGAGAAAQTERVKLPSDVRRYVRVQVTGSSSIGDASGSNVVTRLAL